MNRIPVKSSNLRSVGYDSASQNLEIEFLNSGIYQYSNVPNRVYEDLMSAPSHGQYFDANIKKAGYAYKKVG